MYYNGIVGTRARRFGILPGAFNPPTVAHLALADSALNTVDRVIFVLPETLPHKDYSGVPFATRLKLVQLATDHNPSFDVASTQGGLLIEIARELRARLPSGAQIDFLCGRDAAERIVNWDYGTPDALSGMLKEFGLLVAPRDGDYLIPEPYRTRIASVPLAAEFQAMSATDVRDRIHHGTDWHHLVPPAIHEHVRQLYGPAGSGESR